MKVSAFPPVNMADEHGLLAIGGDLSPETLLLAYRSGIFPWPPDNRTLAWFAPPERGILPVADFHTPRRLLRTIRSGQWKFRLNHRFLDCIRRCGVRKASEGTWITPAMIRGYAALHGVGHALSFEVYREEQLVGGLYGVSIGGYFSGESMFHTERDASKAALTVTMATLKAAGLTWLDCQLVNDHLKQFGVVAISRDDFMARLKDALAKPQPNWQEVFHDGVTLLTS